MEEGTRATLMNHYNTIGWLITSFFLVFLGVIFQVIIEWMRNPESINETFFVRVIITTILFSFLIMRLFLRSQWKHRNIRYGRDFKKREFFSSISIEIYIAFIFSIQLFLLVILYKDPINFLLWFVSIVAVIFLIVLETLNQETLCSDLKKLF